MVLKSNLIAAAAYVGVNATMIEFFPPGFLPALFSGLMGGLVAVLSDWLTTGRWPGYRRAVGHVTVSAITAAFMWPLAHPFVEERAILLELDFKTLVFAGAFLIGVTGLVFVDGIRSLVRKRLEGGRTNE